MYVNPRQNVNSSALRASRSFFRCQMDLFSLILRHRARLPQLYPGKVCPAAGWLVRRASAHKYAKPLNRRRARIYVALLGRRCKKQRVATRSNTFSASRCFDKRRDQRLETLPSRWGERARSLFQTVYPLASTAPRSVCPMDYTRTFADGLGPWKV